MKPITKCIAGLLALTILGLYSPRISFGAGSELLAKADKKPTTLHQPRIKSEPAHAIPTATKPVGQKKKPNWLMIGLAGGLVVLLAAAIGGLGGGGNGSNPPPEGKGDVKIEW